MSDRSVRAGRVIRRTTLLIGAVALAAALLFDLLPGSSPGFGTGQWLLVGLGLLLLGAAALGPRFPAAWRATALVSFNAVVLLVALELAARVIEHVRALLPSAPTSAYALPFYEAQPWTDELNVESRFVNDAERYEPYAMWKRAPFDGRVMSVDQEGRRRTPGSDCAQATVRVFAFGGSTMFGLGSPDGGTIPAWLQARLGTRACVVNFGELGFTSTQGVILLYRQLQRGWIPDVVIFYDGVNDVLAGSLYRQAGLHLDANRIAWLLQGGGSVGWRILSQSRLASLITGGRTEHLGDGGPGRFTVRRDLSAGAVADSIAAVYFHNLRAVRALANEYGFGAAFFWQPTALTTHKALHPVEQRERDLVSAELAGLYAEVQQRVEAAAAGDLYDLRGLFDDLSDGVFYDWHHLTPDGNRLVADAMVSALADRRLLDPVR